MQHVARVAAFVVVAAAAFAAGALTFRGASPASAEEGLSPDGRLFPSHTTEQRWEMSIGVTATGRPRMPQRLAESRLHLYVPSHFGDLFQVTMSGNDAILWYRDGAGAVRNAIADGAAIRGLQIERSETARFELKER